VNLKEDEIFVRKRVNKRIKKCGGCKVPISDDPLEPPFDVCFLRKEKRPKRGKTWSSNNEEDFVLTNTHYHIKSKCIGKINPNKVIISKDVILTSNYFDFLKKMGIVL